MLNNDYTHWQMYAIGGNQNPIIFSQGNRLITRDDNNAKAVTEREDEPYSEYKDWVCLTSSLPSTAVVLDSSRSSPARSTAMSVSHAKINCCRAD